MSLKETTISNMWEIAALVELLERKGLCTKQDLFDIVTESRKRNRRANVANAFPFTGDVVGVLDSDTIEVPRTCKAEQTGYQAGGELCMKQLSRRSISYRPGTSLLIMKVGLT